MKKVGERGRSWSAADFDGDKVLMRVSQRCNLLVLATSFKSGLETSNNNELKGNFPLLEKLEIRIIR